MWVGRKLEMKGRGQEWPGGSPRCTGHPGSVDRAGQQQGPGEGPSQREAITAVRVCSCPEVCSVAGTPIPGKGLRWAPLVRPPVPPHKLRGRHPPGRSPLWSHPGSLPASGAARSTPTSGCTWFLLNNYKLHDFLEQMDFPNVALSPLGNKDFPLQNANLIENHFTFIFETLRNPGLVQ